MFHILRTPAARSASVARVSTPATQAWFEQAERLHDADALRKALAHHIPEARVYSAKAAMLVWSPELAVRADRQRARIARVCAWAVERMKRADDAFAARCDERLAA